MAYQTNFPTFCLGPRVFNAVETKPYERKPTDPLYRPLQIYTLDPSLPTRFGAKDIVSIPYEPLEPGPRGALLEVDNLDGETGLRYQQANLENTHVLINSGYKASPSDPRFHQQMVYAVCSLIYDSFKRALGRNPSWGFKRLDDEVARLILVPHAGNMRNAFYDKETGKLCFGYYQADQQVAGQNLPSSIIFTCLSHDIVSHEFTHAMLDGLRAHFTLPTSPDVLAFHEAFADLVAIFQHFKHKTLLEKAVVVSRGNLLNAELLNFLAKQFGETTGSGRALRTALDKRGSFNEKEPTYPSYQQASNEPHERGSVLVSAIFEAFYTIYNRKAKRYVELATGGSGILPPGEISSQLQSILVEEVSKLAQQFLNICIRAIDYCPPVDLSFGEFLRAIITADYDLVADDPWGYREAWLDAFRLHGIYPEGVSSLSEDAVLWQGPDHDIPEIEALRFGQLAFDGDPGQPSNKDAVKKQAEALGQVITHPDYMPAFGLTNPSKAKAGQIINPPCIESLRSLRRIGPDGQVSFGLVAEVTQRQQVTDSQGNLFDFYGGSTIVLGSHGEVRYTIYKQVTDDKRLERQKGFMQSSQRYWQMTEGKCVPDLQLFKMLHDQSSIDKEP